MDFSEKKTKQVKEEIDLLTVLIEKYDEEIHSAPPTLSPF